MSNKEPTLEMKLIGEEEGRRVFVLEVDGLTTAQLQELFKKVGDRFDE